MAGQQQVSRLEAEIEKIVLIGRPGCGKTVIGRALAALSRRPICDKAG
jgi:shikimate kinase